MDDVDENVTSPSRLNAVNASLPLWSWKPTPLLRPRKWISKRLLGMGDITLSFTAASGHEAVIMPQEVFYVDTSEAMLDGRSLGELVQLDTNPTIGGVPTPARPIFTFGQAHMRITDPEEYQRTRNRIRRESELG